MSDFLQAAKWTEKVPQPHQIAAWNWAWAQLTKDEQDEFLSMFRAGPTPVGNVTIFENNWNGIKAAATAAGAKFPSLVSAQWALESAWGKSVSGKNNYFGIKGSGTIKTTQEVVDGKTITIKDEFMDFATLGECVKYLVERWHCDWKNYEGANNASNRDNAARWLVSEGYATDPMYAERLIRIMNENDPITIPSKPAQPSTSTQPSNPVPQPHLKLTRTKKMNAAGLELLQLEYIKGGKSIGSLMVVSGAPGAQQFRTGSRSRAGSLEPLPEGRWGIEDVAWASGKDNYSGSWGAGLGPVSTPLRYLGPGSTERAAIEIHIDSNARISPGTAGCIGIANEADYRKFVNWLRDTDPRDLFVDYGLGTCPRPK
jgi:hypothetical protein